MTIEFPWNSNTLDFQISSTLNENNINESFGFANMKLSYFT